MGAIPGALGECRLVHVSVAPTVPVPGERFEMELAGLATGIDGATRTEVDGVIGAGLQGSNEFALIVDFGLEIGGALSDIADGVRVGASRPRELHHVAEPL